MDGHRFDRIGAWLMAGRAQGGSVVNLKHVSLVALVIVMTALLGIAEPLAASAQHAESKKGKSQHRTYSSANAMVIPSSGVSSPYPSTLMVSGFSKAKITDINLRLRGYSHTFADDVDVLLVAPNGDSAIVMSDVGGMTSAASLTITLDDGAAAPLLDNGPLTSGAFQPANYSNLGDTDPFTGAATPSGATALATFNGGNPNGAWRLFVVDDTGGDSGVLSGGWDLKITAEVKQDKKHTKHTKHTKH